MAFDWALSSVAPVTIATDADAPIRLAPACAILITSSAVRTPPDALTPSSRPTTRRIRATSSTVAPPLPNPVEVLTNAAPASLDSVQPMIFCSVSSALVSRMTLTWAGAHALTTRQMSSNTVS